jgi:hypothetical protein
MPSRGTSKTTLYKKGWFFMDGRQQNKDMTQIKADNKKENKQIFQIQILHHNVQSLKK